MTLIEVSAPEGHEWHGMRLQVWGAARHSILTLHGAFGWCPMAKRWAWASDRAVSLHWPEPESPEHAALMAEYEGPALVRRPMREDS